MRAQDPPPAMARYSPQECRLKSCSWLPSSTVRSSKPVDPSTMAVVPGVAVSVVVSVVSVVVAGGNRTSHVVVPPPPLVPGTITQV